MALDIYSPDRQDGIQHHEEFVFSLVEREPKRYPELNRIWREFYNDPTISAEQSGQLVHELIDLLDCHKSDPRVVNLAARLIPLFYFSNKKSVDIKCKSD